MYEEYLDKYYDEIYEEYNKRHPEEIKNDEWLLEEDGNENYIEEIIKDICPRFKDSTDYNKAMTEQLIDSIYDKM